MKKVIIASFFAILMLMVPFTAVSQTTNISDTKNVYNDKNTSILNEEIRFYITTSDYNQIVNYIETEVPEDNKSEAYDILNEIVTPHGIYGYEVDMAALAQAWAEHGYKSIDPNDIENAIDLETLEALLEKKWVFDILGEFVNFITSIQPIRNRLGWAHRVINDMYFFTKEGVFIALHVTVYTLKQLQALANAVNFIVSVPETLYQAINDLVNNRIQEFKIKISGLINDFVEITIELIPYAIALLAAFESIINFLDRLLDFILDMLAETPWNDKIRVHGTVFKNFPGDVTITCRGQSTSVGQGSFDFYIDVNPDETSIPANEFYGIHDCQITVEQDGEILKQSTKILSYVFSDGSIFWPFIIIKGRSRSAGFNTLIMERIYNFFAWIQLKFPILSRILFGLDTQPI